LGVYAGALSVGTHWPRLELGDPTRPPDKMLHFVAFGGLAFFLWQARYVRRVTTLLLIGVAWTALDEITQALPVLQRSFSFEDVVASACGVLAVSAIIAATRPLGGPFARLRRRRFDLLLDALLSRATPWMAILSAAALGAAVGVPLLVLLNGFTPDPVPFQAAVTGGLFGAGVTGPAMALLGLRREEETMSSRRRCLGCGEEGIGPSCPSCGMTALPGQWAAWPSIGWPDLIRACLRPLLGGAATLLFLLVLSLSVLALRPAWPPFAMFDDWYRSLSKGMPAVLDGTALAVIGALTVWRCRVRIARRLDASAERCLGCAQDLRGTPVDRDRSGRCGECGAAFLRL
jgi:VanZ family protein